MRGWAKAVVALTVGLLLAPSTPAVPVGAVRSQPGVYGWNASPRYSVLFTPCAVNGVKMVSCEIDTGVLGDDLAVGQAEAHLVGAVCDAPAEAAGATGTAPACFASVNLQAFGHTATVKALVVPVSNMGVSIGLQGLRDLQLTFFGVDLEDGSIITDDRTPQ